MNMLHCIWKRMKKIQSDNSGVAMLFAMIVGVVVMVFCLSLLLVTYTLYAQTSRKTTQTQCKLFAQSFADSLEEEIRDTDSELNRYLATQIEDGNWISQNELLDSGELAGAVSDLIMDLNQDRLDNYSVTVVFTYDLNETDDDPGDSEDDDQDDDGNVDDGSGGAGSGGDDPNDDPVGNGNYTIHAIITCYRGGLSESDVQTYTLEKEYDAVPLGSN